MIIKNASSIPLNQNSGTLPDVSGALLNWFQKMVFTRVTKKQVNYATVEEAENINFEGVWQVMSAQSLSMKPTGQRDWKWFTVHAQPSLILIPDEVITYQGTQYRVKDKIDYKEYGYVEYGLVQDYIGSGPTTPPVTP